MISDMGVSSCLLAEEIRADSLARIQATLCQVARHKAFQDLMPRSRQQDLDCAMVYRTGNGARALLLSNEQAVVFTYALERC